MDELDKLKSIWQSASGYTGKNKDEIARMLQGESASIVARLKRNVWIELLFTVVTGIALIYIGITSSNNRLSLMIAVLMVIYIFYLIYYIRKLRMLKRFSITGENIKNNLQHLTGALQGYLNFYKLSYIILYPLFFIAGLWIAARDEGMDNFLERFNNAAYLIRFLLLTALLMSSVYLFTNWYLKKLYGNHLKKLQGMLKELDD
ncbi:MAG: hypothetical protein N2044_06970 [Cyclobacteriaceae bacterium]|nr:hypothetical protein [Cyclobacteriaceae bacterium]MCX7637566.1 hypothetical protein [Cyclobacteriaceae bacterium]MDW8331206.1 hypothetical protein [Cyclobacteriaceae bacterium]